MLKFCKGAKRAVDSVGCAEIVCIYCYFHFLVLLFAAFVPIVSFYLIDVDLPVTNEEHKCTLGEIDVKLYTYIPESTCGVPDVEISRRRYRFNCNDILLGIEQSIDGLNLNLSKSFCHLLEDLEENHHFLKGRRFEFALYGIVAAGFLHVFARQAYRIHLIGKTDLSQTPSAIEAEKAQMTQWKYLLLYGLIRFCFAAVEFTFVFLARTFVSQGIDDTHTMEIYPVYNSDKEDQWFSIMGLESSSLYLVPLMIMSSVDMLLLFGFVLDTIMKLQAGAAVIENEEDEEEKKEKHAHHDKMHGAPNANGNGESKRENPKVEAYPYNPNQDSTITKDMTRT